jgi:glucose/arabinose dehydrogenase/mono/diheme cytochrome c family protein
MSRIICTLLACALVPFLIPAADSPKPFSLDRRVALETSKVVGWPDPPPPYRTRRLFEKFTFRNPLYLTSNPAHNLLFVVEQNGNIVHFSPRGDKKPERFVQLVDADTYGMTFHPQYRTNKFVYLFSNGPNSKSKRFNQILRYRVTGDPPRCDPASKTLIIEWQSNGHNGGDLAFGPDGMLYITSGDGTSDSDTDNTGQDLTDLCSGILRIDVDNSAPGKPYRVPAGNPFVKMKDARPELWAFGMRNPWRMTFDPDSGDLLVGDIGQDRWEMILLVKRGNNHGWAVKEGTHDFHPMRKRGPGPIVPPLIEHPHSEGRSITGGLVYKGKKFPELRGTYLYGDYSTGKIWGLRQKHGKISWKGDLAQTRLQILGFGADLAGEVYVVDYAGQIHTLEKSPPVKGVSTFPRTLGDSGLFRSVKNYLLHPSLIPYDVNSPLWSDGAHKERAIALPGLEQVGFTEQGPWQFPEKTVLVKTFALDTPEGKRKRIETRFLTLQQGEWFGYSYAWNEEQTEATLVESAGMTRPFTIRDPAAPAGKGTLEWRYPSRVECMVCHTRAAAFVLGLTTMQMNREHDYNGVRKNQLEALANLGVFRLTRLQHWEEAEVRLRGLGQIWTAMGKGPMAALSRCGLEPATRAVAQRIEAKKAAIRASVAAKGQGSTHLPRRHEEYPRLVDPYDRSADRTARVRSYLHSNCSICHVEAGGGNAAINLHVDTSLDKMKLLGEAPLHDRFGIKDAKLVAPGAPERSILYQRISRRGTGQMPPLASSRVDDEAVQLLREWIRSLK